MGRPAFREEIQDIYSVIPEEEYKEVVLNH